MSKKQLIESLRRAVVADGRTLYRISKDHQISFSTLQRLRAGRQRELTLDSATRIAAACNHELLMRPIAKKE